MDKCGGGGGAIEATKETLVLALQFADSTLTDSPEIATKVLQNPRIRKAIESALLSEARRLLKQQQKGQASKADDGKKVLTSVVSGVSSAAQAAAKKEIKSSGEYKAVTKSLKQLECAYRGSPIGIFVDKNKGWLIVVATGLALGGATAMYVAKSGDWPAGQMGKLAGKLVRFKVMGNVEIGLEKVEFKPSERSVGATTFASGKWKSVSTKVSFHVGFKDDKFASTNAAGEVVVKAGSGVSLTGKGKVGYGISPDAAPGSQPLTYNLSLGISYGANIGGSSLNVRLMGYAAQESLARKQGGKLGVSYKMAPSKSTSVGVDLNAQLSRTQQLGSTGPAAPQVAGSVNLGLTIKFP
jgi:hypothetical protein